MAIKLIGATSGIEADVEATSKALKTILYDSAGRPIDNVPTYYLYQAPRVTTAAATDYFDLFNATGSGFTLKILGLWSIIQIVAATAFTAAWQWSVIQTSAVGTGGTGHGFEGAAAPATGVINISRVDDADAVLPAQITARSIPTGGATAQKFLFDMWLLPEETLATTIDMAFWNAIPVGRAVKEPIIPQNKGLKVRQVTAVASTNMNFGWLLAFGLY
jgi:hypothetical protein